MHQNNLSTCILIPARYKSSRFPGKPLALIDGKPMIIRVCEVSEETVGKSNVFVATDDERIANLVCKFGYRAIMTSPNALTGTDRIAEAAKSLDYDIYLNLQGDEPLVNKSDLLKCIELKKNNMNFVFNGYTEIKKYEDHKSINLPKVVFNESKNLVYISRSPIPICKEFRKNQIYYKQVCIYGFTLNELNKFAEFGRKSLLEEKEDIEILRFLELDIDVKMFHCDESSCAVDVPEDIELVEEILRQRS